MKKVERAFRPLGFAVQAAEQRRIALGVHADDRMAVSNILPGRQLQRPGLAHAGGADIEDMPLPFGARQHDPPLAFQQSDAVQGRQPAFRGGARRGTRDFDEAAIGGAGGIPQPLGMPRRPQKAPAEEQPRRVGIER